MSGKKVGLGIAAAAALSLAVLWTPLSGRRVHAREHVAAEALAKRSVQISPVELAHLMHNRQVSLKLWDLRPEAEYNAFHVLDAKRIDLRDLDPTPFKAASPRRVIVLLDDDETQASLAYKRLVGAGVQQVYVLEGGVPAWLSLFAHHAADGADPLAAGSLGDRHPASFPDIEHLSLPAFEPKVKLQLGGKKGAAGCGG